ncbi:MAG: hypothetical protein ACP5QU_01375 [Anaerolineae bacterium]
MSLVECRSDSEYAERPLAFTWQGERHQVAEIVQRWHEPGKKVFVVKTSDEQVFQLTYDESSEQWEIRLK